MNNDQYMEETEIDLMELIYVMLRKWWLILIAALLGMTIAVGITKCAITPMYQSQAMIYVLTKTTSVTSMVDLQIGDAITEDFKIIATSKPVVDMAIEEIEKKHDVTFTRKEISDMLTVTNISDTRILKIEALSDDPEYACWVANAVADATATRMKEIMQSDPPTTVERAEVENTPVSPSLLKNAAIGFLLGVILVCGVLVIRFIVDDTIKSEDDIQKYLGTATLCMIPVLKNKGDKKNELKRVKGARSGKR